MAVAVTSVLGTLEDRHHTRTVSRLDSGIQMLQIRTEPIKHPEQLHTVGKTDIVPHLWIAGGNTREIAKPPCGEAEDLLVLFHARQGIDQRIGQHVGRWLVAANTSS